MVNNHFSNFSINKKMKKALAEFKPVPRLFSSLAFVLVAIELYGIIVPTDADIYFQHPLIAARQQA
jgi:hypothetical protein